MPMPTPPRLLPAVDFRPWKLSGVVIGALLNDPATLEAIGAAAHEPPYKAPPRAPVLYVKPHNSLMPSGAHTTLPDGVSGLSIGAAIGLVIGRATCRVSAQTVAAGDAGFIAGYTLVVDLFVPHASLYRPSVRERAFDASCVVGPTVIAPGGFDPDDAVIDIRIDGARVQSIPTKGLIRPAAQLVADISEFMTLQAGDVLLAGVRHAPPRIEAGQTWSVACAAIGSLDGSIVAAGPDGFRPAEKPLPENAA